MELIRKMIFRSAVFVYHYGMTADAALKQFAAQHSTGVLYYQIQ
jgi:hypothetical protein